MQTVITTNNAYDTILLVDANDVVVSAWQADASAIDSYLRDGADANNWQAGEWPRGFNPDADEFESEEIADQLRTITAYGNEVGRNGQITDQGRREFWGVISQ